MKLKDLEQNRQRTEIVEPTFRFRELQTVELISWPDESFHRVGQTCVRMTLCTVEKDAQLFVKVEMKKDLSLIPVASLACIKLDDDKINT